jgi:1-acyl-sn-glycerol-3-phosphate acyltransferase
MAHPPAKRHPRIPMSPAEYRALRRRYSWKLRWADSLNRFICKLWYRHRQLNPCTIPPSGPVIVTANHTCSADPMMIYAGCGYRRMSFMIAEEFANLPIGGWFVRLIECIPVKRDGMDSAATRKALRQLRDGRAIGIFIEGRIPEPGEYVDPKEGVALLALRTGATVVPIHISGNQYRESIVAGLFARHRAVVHYGAPMDLAEFGGSTRGDNVQKATEQIWQAIQALDPERRVVTEI